MSRDPSTTQNDDETEAPVPLGRVRSSTTHADAPAPGAAVVDDAVPAAAAIQAERVVRQRAERPSGWRGLVARASLGALGAGPTRAEARERELLALAKTPIAGARTVVFVSRKGGVGKTTTCLLAGHTFASYRGDRVVALDASPDAGTLAHRLRRDTHETVGTLLRDGLWVERYADVRAYTSQAPSRLEVIAGDDGPAVTQALGEAQITALIGLLERHYTLLLLDTQAGLLTPAAGAALACADQLVLVSPAALDGAQAAGSTLDWLAVNGHAALAEQAVAVVNGIPDRRGDIDVDRIEEHFRARCRSCVRLPFDPHLGTGAEVDPTRLRPTTRRACLELAAAIATGFTTPRRHR